MILLVHTVTILIYVRGCSANAKRGGVGVGSCLSRELDRERVHIYMILKNKMMLQKNVDERNNIE